MDSPLLTDDDNGAVQDDTRPTFYIGHHDSKRTEVSPQLLQQAQDCGVSISQALLGGSRLLIEALYSMLC